MKYVPIILLFLATPAFADDVAAVPAPLSPPTQSAQPPSVPQKQPQTAIDPAAKVTITIGQLQALIRSSTLQAQAAFAQQEAQAVGAEIDAQLNPKK
jgi:hypothetical protein